MTNIMDCQDLSVLKQIVGLQNLSKSDLESMWGKFFDHSPEVSSREYMISKLAYRIQELAYGGVDNETEAKIKACAKVIETSKKTNSRKFSPMIGTKITKDYRGKLHEVLVVTDGFAYNGEVFKSLSAIATKITGTKWNGLKFFNVKE